MPDKTDYDLVEDLGNQLMGQDDWDTWAILHEKLRQGVPAKQHEVAWLAFKAGLLSCDCESCIKQRQRHLDQGEVDDVIAGKLVGTRFQHVQRCRACQRIVVNDPVTLEAMDKSLDTLMVAMGRYLHAHPEKP